MEKYFNKLIDMTKTKEGIYFLLFLVAVIYVVFGLLKINTRGRKSLLKFL